MLTATHNQRFWNICNTINNYSKYVPFLSFFTSLTDVLIKCILSSKHKVIPKNRFFSHILEKSYRDHLIPLIPIGGNIAYIFLPKRPSEKKEKMDHPKISSSQARQKKENFSKRTQKSIDTNSPRAKYIFSKWYRDGSKFPHDEVKGLALLKEAAELGESEAMWDYANWLFYERKDRENAFIWCEKAANKGFVLAMLDLGALYQNGLGIEQSEAKSFEWYLKAANLGESLGKYHVGLKILRGKGTEKNEKLAFDWLKSAAEDGVAEAMSRLAAMYEKGKGVEVDLKKSFEWHEKAANKNLPIAMFNLSRFYYSGIEIEKDLKKAFYWMEKAALKDFTKAFYFLGVMYLEGEGIEKNEERALVWLIKAAKEGHEQAYFKLGGIYLSHEESEKAIKCFFKAANSNHIPAMYKLGKIYLEQCKEENCDKEALQKEAFKCFQKAALSGERKSMNKIGEMYFYGIGIERNEELAWECFKKALDLDYPIAMLNMAHLYAFGEMKNHTVAKECYLKALENENLKKTLLQNAEEQNPKTLQNLGYLFEHGIVFEQNLEKAKNFYELADKGLKEFSSD